MIETTLRLLAEILLKKGLRSNKDHKRVNMQANPNGCVISHPALAGDY
jgi:hypothetical protein